MEKEMMMTGRLAKRSTESKALSKSDSNKETESKGKDKADEIRKKRIEQIRAKFRK